MSKLRMIAGRQARGGDGIERVGAYVVLAAGRMTRIFSVRGTTSAPIVSELGAATTIDLRRFESELEADLPGVTGAPPARPADAWVSGVVRDHLKRTENLDVE